MFSKTWFAGAATACVVAFGASFATAATVDITLTQMPDVTATNTAMTSFLGSIDLFESFEGFAAGTSRNPLTSVGSFAGQGRIGSGSTAINCGAGKGNGACVKPGGPAGGRFATDGTKWLDSNDMPEIVWTLGAVPGAPTSDVSRIAFLLTDIDDVGRVAFSIAVNGDALGARVNSVSGGLPNGRLHLVTMDFSDAVRNLTITLKNGHNDGFGIDSVGVALVEPPVPMPLPATAWLMIAGVGGLVAMRRRRA